MGIREWWRATMGTDAERQNDPLAFSTWMDYFSFNGTTYPLTTYGGQQGTVETIGPGFTSYVNGAYANNGVVFTCMAVRMLLFAEARFQYRQFKDGRPGDLFGNADLIPLHQPWPGGTTGDLLTSMITDADLAGDAFVLRQGSRLRRLRPDWVTIVYGSPREDSSMWDLDAELVGYFFQEGGPGKNKEPKFLPPATVAHFSPYPDPLSPHRGMSWITPVVREVMADTAATSHKGNFYDKGATVNLTIEYDPAVTTEVFNQMVASFKEGHEGAANAYKTLHLLGAKANPIGTTMQQQDFKAIQGAGETRIAAASGVGPIIAQLSEGLQGSALNAGNYSSARRRVADGLMRPLWRNAAGSLANIIRVPARAELWYDERDISWLREDEADRATIQETQARTITTYVNAGYDSDSAVASVLADDPAKLKHSGLLSVQLQPPGTVAEPAALPAPSTNGNTPAEVAP